jgi:uncharacterized protein
MQEAVADVEPAPPGAPSHWVSHVVVTNLAESKARATSLGGAILSPDVHVPNVGTMSILRDPVGAVVSLFQPASNAPT